MSELFDAIDNINKVMKKIDELDEDMHGACDACLTGWHENCLDVDCKCSDNAHNGVLN